MSWIRRVLALGLAPLLVAALLSGCSESDAPAQEAESAGESSATGDERDGDGGEAEEDDEDQEEEAVPVEVVEIGRGRIEETLRFSTNLEAEREVQVFSQAARQVTGLLVEEGDEVRKGQVLLRLEDEEQKTQLARVESQLANSRREYERQQNLFAQQLISEQVFNEATYDLEQLELALADARRELGYTEVRAPISGTVTRRLVNLGDQVTVNQHLFDIIDFDSIVARVYVPEKSLPRLSPGQPARVFADAFRDEEHRGTVDRIAPLVDARSGTVKVTVALPRSESLLPGMYVSVELVTAVREDAVLVPKRALVYDDEQVYLYRLSEAPATATADAEEAGGEEAAAAELTVERLLVTPVLEDRENIEPAGRVEVGDLVVVAGQAGLKDGAAVRLVGGAG